MKKAPLSSLILVAALVTSQPLVAQAQTTATTGSVVSPGAQIAAVQATITAYDQPSQPIGPNHRTTVRASKTGNRQIVEIGTGLNYFNGQQWVPSNPTFVPTANGFIASQIQHPVQLASDLFTTNAVTLSTPEGIILGSTPVAIGLYDSASGNFAIIATTTNSTAMLVESNQVIYPDAFGGNACASVVYTVGAGSFNQDVVFTGTLDPADYGFPRATTLIQIITEFYGAPTPDTLTRPLYIESNPAVRAKMVSPDLIDEQLGFGRFVLTTGTAYVSPSTGNPDGWETVVAKQYQGIGDGTYLIESVPYASVAGALSNLPPCHPLVGSTKLNSTKGYVSIPRPHKKGHSAPLLAQATHASPHGVVIDYVANIGGPMSGVTVFQGDTTYLVSSAVSCNGPTTIEGGAVFKYKSGTSISLNSTLTWKTGQYRPAVFTGVDDDAIGDTMNGMTNSGYTGTINLSGYANPALYAPGAMNFSGIRIRYAQEAIKVFGGSTYTLSHAQLVSCLKGVEIQINSCGCGIATSYFNVNNSLFSHVFQSIVGTLLGGCSANQYVNLLNATFDQGSTFGSPGCGITLSIQSTNSIYTGITNKGSIGAVGNLNAFYNNWGAFGVSPIALSSSPYLGVGAGNYYLTNVLGIQTGATTNGLPSSLISDLGKRTTYGPQVYATTTLSTNLTLTHQVLRDTYVSSLGYHYDPIDFAFGNVYASNASVSASAGVSIATFGTNGTGYGLGFGKGSSFTSIGTPNLPDRISLFNTVQEGTNLNWQRLTNSVTGELYGATPAPGIYTRFTLWSVLAQDAAQFYAPTNSGPLAFQDSEFHGGKLISYRPTINLTNCLLDRVYASLLTSDGNSPYIRNNLFRGGTFNYAPNVTNSFVADNLFDQTSIPTNTTIYTNYNGGYNAFVTNANRLLPTVLTDVVLTNSPNYQTGPLGLYYQTNNSVLINAGHTNANFVGLYHYTVMTNLVGGLEINETNSMVDIGYHYAATDANGNPIDSNGDGIPDYLEDANGDGLVDNGETNWALSILTQPISQTVPQSSNATFTVTAGGIAPIYYQWYFNNTNGLAGATNASLVISNAQAAQAGNYSAQVTNAFGTLTSSNAVLTVNISSITYTSFCNASSLQMNGNCGVSNTADGCVIELTPPAVHQAGSAFFGIPIPLTNSASFSTFFSFRLSHAGGTNDPGDDGQGPNGTNGIIGADGITFVLLTQANKVGTNGGYLGYGGLTNSVAIEFDTWWNTNIDPNITTNLHDGNHVGLDTNGSLTSLTTTHINDPMNNSNIWYAWVDFNGAASNLQVRVSETNSRPASPNLTYSLNPVNYLGTNTVYVGFTGATGSSYNQQDILTWQFNAFYQPIGLTSTLTFLAPTNGQNFIITPTNILMVVTNSGGSITNVGFLLNDTNSLGVVAMTNGLATLLWTNATAGTWKLTATNNATPAIATSIFLTNNAMPTVAIVSPTNLQSFVEVTDVPFTVTASDSDGTITNVVFYSGTNVVGSTNGATSGTNTFTWRNLTAGFYPVTVVATDNRGASAVSAIILFKVNPTNAPPQVAVTFPTNNSVFSDGSDITITATVTNGAGTVTNVEFFVNALSIGSTADSPYAVTKCCWSPGTYVIVAKATDTFGAVGISSPVTNTIVTDVPVGAGFWDSTFQLSNGLAYPYPGLPMGGDCTNYVKPFAINSMATYGSDIYLAASDRNASDYEAPACYKGDGTNWVRWGGINENEWPCYDIPLREISGVAANSSGIYVSGLSLTNTSEVYHLTMSNTWSKLGESFTNGIYAFALSDFRVTHNYPKLQFVGSDLYLYGNLVGMDHPNAQYIAKWNSNSNAWDQVGTTLNGPVLAVAGLKGNLVIGGLFTTAGGNTNANHVAELNGETWTNLGTGVGGVDWEDVDNSDVDAGVFSIAVCNTNLFVGGDFTYAGTITNANSIAMWNGIEWLAIGQGLFTMATNYPASQVTTNPIVYSISIRGNLVFVGGGFNGAVNSDGTAILASSVAKAMWNEGSQQWTWSDLDVGLLINDGIKPCTALCTVIMGGPTPSEYDVLFGGSYPGNLSTAGWAQQALLAIARWRVGYAEPPSLQVITVTNPPNMSFYTNLPSDIELIATSSRTNITQVDFLVDGNWLYTDYTPATNVFNYDYTVPSYLHGPHLFTAIATDTDGLRVKSSPVSINIAVPTNALTAVDDLFILTANCPPTTLKVLSNDSTTPVRKLRVLDVEPPFSFLPGQKLGTAQVSFDGSSIIYAPNPNLYGTDFYVYTVTDGVTTNSANLVVKVRVQPFIGFQNPNDGLKAATNCNVIVNGATFGYDTTLTNILITVNGTPWQQFAPTNINYQSNATSFFFTLNPGAVSPQSWYAYFTNNWNTTLAGYYTFEAFVSDSYGYTASSVPVTVIVTNSWTATNVLTASISNLPVTYSSLNTPILTVVRDGLFDLKGQARDTQVGDAVAYQVLLHPPGDPNTLIANVTPQPRDVNGFHQGGDMGGDLGTNDFTGIPNGVYDMELIVHGGGAETNYNVIFELDSQLKLGQFSFSEQDLVLPVNGIPLTVTRTYNSLNPISSDFGNNWSFALNDMDVQLDDSRQNVTIGSDTAPWADDESDDNGLPKIVNVRTGGGWDVTLTLPDGRRTTFKFDYDGVWPNLYAKWDSPPGVTAKLSMIGNNELVFGFSGATMPTWADSDFTLGNAPLENQDIQGWILETQDGTKYQITRGSANNLVMQDPANPGQFVSVRAYGPPKLTQIEERSRDSIAIGDNGIFHYNATNNLTRSALFERDYADRITAIRDPNAGSNGLPTVQYVYNRDTGNLIQVLKLWDPSAGTYVTNSYLYNNPNFPHYITGIINANGVPTVRTLYDDSGRMIGMIDADGRTNSFVHDINNRQEIQYDRSGQPTYYTYDTRGNIIGTTDALGHTNSFAFDANGYMTNSVDALGHVTSFSNDASGNVLSVTVPYPTGADPANYTTSFTWDQYGNQTSVKLPSGGIVTNVFDPATGNLLATKDEAGNVISATTYNAAGLPSSEADKFGTNCFGYDSAGNPTSFTNSLGKVATNGFDANGNLTAFNDASGTSTVNYDAMNRQTSANYGNGVSASYGYQNDGDWSTVSSPTVGTMQRNTDDQGRVSGWTTANGSTPGFAYDANGRMEYETNSIGVVTRSVYNAVGWLVATTNLTTGAWIAYGYDDAGRKIAVTNALGQVTRFAYWPSGSLMAMTNALGTNYWLYSDAAGACSACGNSGSVTDALGRVTESVQSPHGLPLQTIRFASVGATGANAATNTITYLSGMTTPEQDAQEYPASVTDEGGRTRQYDYTALGQLYRATDLSGATWWTNQFDPNTGMLTNVLSPTGEPLSYTYDGLNNVQTIRFGDGNWLTNFYNAQNRLSGVRLPSGVALTNFYDFAGRLTNHSSTIGETASFAYNGNDAVTAMTDNTGGTTNLLDAAGRLWGIDYPSGASVRYQLDLLNRITAITNRASAGGTAYVTKYQYDAVGNITNVIDPFSGQTSFTFDQAGRRSTRTLPNGIVTTWQYNWKDQVTNIVHKTGGGTVLASVAYVRAAGGEPTQITREDGTYVVLGYDAALRLTNEVYYSSGGVAQTTNSYGFDASGNRVLLVKAGTTLTNSVSAGYRITAVKNGATTVESYAFDNGGRETTITRDSATLNLGYNSADQVTAVTNGATWVTYVHDANGRRTVSTNSAGTVRRLLVAPTPGTDLESPHLIADAGGTIQQGYVYLGDKPMLRYTSSGTAVYYLDDGMGSVIGLAPSSSPSPANTTCLFYDGFGNSRATNGPAPTIPTSAGGDFRFQGAWLETASGLYNMRAREYDARTGRFTSRDSVKPLTDTPETFNPYIFAADNPVIYRDATGHEFTLVELSVGDLINSGLDALQNLVIQKAKSKLEEKIVGAFLNTAVKAMAQLYPPAADLLNILTSNPLTQGNVFQGSLLGAICSKATGGLAQYLWFEVGIDPATGNARDDGFHCPPTQFPTIRKGVRRADLVVGPGRPTQAGSEPSYLVCELKRSGDSLYFQYVEPGRKWDQLEAILNYAEKNTTTHVAVFFTVFSGDTANLNRVRLEVLKEGLADHTLALVISAKNGK